MIHKYRTYGRKPREVKSRRLDIVKVTLEHETGEFAIKHERFEIGNRRRPQLRELFLLIEESGNAPAFNRREHDLFHGLNKKAFAMLPKDIALGLHNGFLLPRVLKAAFDDNDALALTLLVNSYLGVKIPFRLREQHDSGQEIGYDKTMVATDVWRAWVDWKVGVAAGKLKTDLGHFVRNRLKENWKKLYASVAPQYPDWIGNPCGDMENFAETPMIGSRTDSRSGLVILPEYHGEIASSVPDGDERTEANETGEGNADEGCAFGVAFPGHDNEDLGDVRHGGSGSGSVDHFDITGAGDEKGWQTERDWRNGWREQRADELRVLRNLIFPKTIPLNGMVYAAPPMMPVPTQPVRPPLEVPGEIPQQRPLISHRKPRNRQKPVTGCC